MSREKIYQSIIISLFITMGVTMSQVIFATWDPPTATPPGNNVLAPINVSDSLQYKDGPFHVSTSNYGNEYGLVVENGMTWTKGGLEIEILSTDPTSPQDGRIWIRQ